jgi:hypothetical protein
MLSLRGASRGTLTGHRAGEAVAALLQPYCVCCSSVAGKRQERPPVGQPARHHCPQARARTARELSSSRTTDAPGRLMGCGLRWTLRARGGESGGPLLQLCCSCLGSRISCGAPSRAPGSVSIRQHTTAYVRTRTHARTHTHTHTSSSMRSMPRRSSSRSSSMLWTCHIVY